MDELPSLEELLQPPEHEQNAEQFINSVLKEVAPKYSPNLTIRAVNTTKDDLETFTSMVGYERDGGNNVDEEYFQLFSDEEDIKSATQTRVAVFIEGESAELIQKAVEDVNAMALKLKGTKTRDHTHEPNKNTKLVEAIGVIVNLPSFQKYLEYTFGDDTQSFD